MLQLILLQHCRIESPGDISYWIRQTDVPMDEDQKRPQANDDQIIYFSTLVLPCEDVPE